MSLEETVEVQTVRQFAAPPEGVFDAWINTEIARKWLFSAPTGAVVRVEIDARAGGAFVVVDRREGDDVEHVGTYVEVDRPSRLIFDFSVPKYTDAVTRVTIDITAIETGCELTLTHAGVWSDYADQTRSGWSKMLEGLDRALQA